MVTMVTALTNSEYPPTSRVFISILLPLLAKAMTWPCLFFSYLAHLMNVQLEKGLHKHIDWELIFEVMY